MIDQADRKQYAATLTRMSDHIVTSHAEVTRLTQDNVRLMAVLVTIRARSAAQSGALAIENGLAEAPDIFAEEIWLLAETALAATSA